MEARNRSIGFWKGIIMQQSARWHKQLLLRGIWIKLVDGTKTAYLDFETECWLGLLRVCHRTVMRRA
jgi:hypothetical protein